ncbi:hypothetical protein SLEP1_g24709 [Rubroshorea leprosula]|uniref:Integrase catalytic domain-containing protein n=1 Tax=Rubroshorea leprosula TaxID=152421 RepID=A0AAV5JQR2_9ROSI|nr:hypothetical protein SLEP1_g24709 [Rubroshorea leprosula]
MLDPKRFQGELAKPETKAECLGTITFTDEDLQLGAHKHNRPLYGQHAIGKIHINFQIVDMATSALFHVIEAKTSYELLLGRTLIHENGEVLLTWHQCFKYHSNGKTKCVMAEKDPFTKEESHFSDANFYEKEDDDSEAFPIKMPQIKQKNDGKIIVHPIKDPSSSSKVHLSIEDVKVLKEDLVLPLSTLSKLGISNPVIKEVVEIVIEHEKKPQGWFDPRPQMLLKKIGFKERESQQLGDLNSILIGPVPSPLTIQENLSQKPLVFYRLGAKQQNSKKVSKSQKVQKNKNKYVQRKEFQWRRKDIFDGQEISKLFAEVKVAESNHVSIEKIFYSDDYLDEEPNPAPEAFKGGRQATIDELKQHNLDTKDDLRPIFLNVSLSSEEEARYVQLLTKYKDVFAWSYKEMLGLDPKVAIHRLAMTHGVRPMKQSQRHFRPKLIPQIEAEAIKVQALANFLADHPIPAEWELLEGLPDEEVFFIDVWPSWKLYFDGASRRDGARAGVVLEMALEMQIYQLNVYGDSSLVVNQLIKEFDVLSDLGGVLIPSRVICREDLWGLHCKGQSFDGVLLRCLDGDKSSKVIEEAHSRICGTHQSGPKLHYRIRRMGYYWPTMPPEPLHPTIASWPFDAWGLDVIGPITLKSSARHAYILAATDYFSKWVKTVPLREVKKENVVDFIRVNIIYRYGVPRYIITNNGKPFSNSLIDKLCARFKFAQHFSSMYNAAANGLAESFNKTLCNLLNEVVSKSKWDWHERTAVLFLECQIPSLKIAIQEGLTDEQNVKLHLQELEALDEKRLETQQHLECYQARLSRAFNKKVRLRAFQVGHVVLAV